MLMLLFWWAKAMNTQLVMTVQMMNMLNNVSGAVKAGTLQDGPCHSVMVVEAAGVPAGPLFCRSICLLWVLTGTTHSRPLSWRIVLERQPLTLQGYMPLPHIWPTDLQKLALWLLGGAALWYNPCSEDPCGLRLMPDVGSAKALSLFGSFFCSMMFPCFLFQTALLH